MNVRTLCLSILQKEEASGYEIRKMCTEGNCAYFVEASFGSIYPALSKLEDEGLVTSRVEHQEGKPSKKVYAITQAGRDAFIDSLFEPVDADVFRSPFLLFARFAHLLPATLVEKRVKERIARYDEEIAELKEHRTKEALTPNDAWVLNYGIAALQSTRDHLSNTMNDLIATAQPDGTAAEAAE